MSDPAASAPSRNPILWGSYLACSWTWCIGMFLPILLLREMGWAGYWIFAIPNMIGAAAMGWLIKSRGESVRFIENHAQAIWWFSAVTLAFHLYWIFWLSSFLPVALGIPENYLAGGMGFVCLLAWIASRTVRRGQAPKVALALVGLSLSVLLGTLFSSGLQEANASLLGSVSQSVDAYWMLPVMLFGFLLCPYLDITFHHARQQLDTTPKSRLGFFLGFVVFFPFMIFLTTRYAGMLTGAINGAEPSSMVNPWLAVGILLHMLCQWFFTVSVHLDRIRTLPNAASKKTRLIVLLMLAGVIGVLVSGLPAYKGLTAGEIGYRMFMSAYGLVFPSYVLYRVMARRTDETAKPYSMWIAISLTVPFFWMGFIERQPAWMLPGMALIFLGAIIQRKK